MERQSGKEKLAIQIGIGLIAGTFSIIPVASGAPVLDKVVSGGAAVSSGATTTVTSATKNNVIDWKAFSVAQGEKVEFDHGAKTNNYLNIVTGAAVSQVDGAIEGGANVYLVNPNGVIFGKTASIDVGNLYVSTRNIGAVASSADLSNPAAVLASGGISSAAGDIVNLGKIQADAVIAEGKNITFLNTANVTNLSGAVNTNVTLNSNQGTIRIGERAVPTVSSNSLSLLSSSEGGSVSARALYQTSGGAVENYTLITNQTELQNINADLAGKYYLGNDISCAGAYTPVGDDKTPFTGVFDGQYYTVANIASTGKDYAGLFGYISNATVQNVGIIDASIKANKFAGGVAGYAVGSTIHNVYNAASGTGTLINSDTSYQSGGIAGGIKGTTISSAYNTGIIGNKGGGIAGTVYDNAVIQDAYNTQTAFSSGIAGLDQALTGAVITHVYTTGEKFSIDPGINGIVHGTSYSNGAATKNVSSYSGWDISNVGGENTVWRIYEGQSLPLLRAFLTANGTVTTNYAYTQGPIAGSNGGKDLSLTYNNNDVNFSGVSYTAADGSPITSGIQKVGDKPDDKPIRNVAYDTTNNKVTTTAVFYTGQNGYDLVGNNVTIDQREVTISDDLSGKKITKEYDGTTDASKAVSSLFYGDAGSATGIIDKDSTVSVDSSNITATYDDENVGAGKAVTIKGSISLDNAAGYHNYKLSANSADFGNKVITGNSITQKELTVSLGKSTGINREYDGTTTVTGVGKPSDTQITYDTTGLVTVTSGGKTIPQTVELAYDSDANYVDSSDVASKNAGTYTNRVKYSGIRLASGTYSKNYKLVDAAGNVLYSEKVAGLDGTGINEGTGGALYGSGTISKKNISSQGFSWYKDNAIQPASREYDASSVYKDPVNYTVSNNSSSVTDKMLPGDNLSFTVQSADFINSADGMSKTKTKNVSDAKGVLYTVAVSGSDAGNYTLDGAALTNTAIVVGTGSITPRTINLAVTDTKAVKTYDGDADVKINDKNSFSLGEAGIAYASGTDTAHHLIDGDDNNIHISGKYQQTSGEAAQDVNYSSNAVQDKKIAYTANVVDAANNASSNYTLVFNAGMNNEMKGTTLSVSGTGIIKQRELTGITFGDVSKTYDTKTGVVGGQASDKVTVTGLTGLVGPDTVSDVLSTTNIKGDYGTRSGSTFIASADVLRDASNNVMSKDVQYTGVSQSLDGAKAHNYTLGTLSNTQYGRGTINPLTINSADQLTLDRNGRAITKVYDGKTDVAYDGVTANSYVDKLYTTVGSTKVYIDYTVADADYATKNSQNNAMQDVTYTLDVSKGNGNYEIANTALTNGKLEKTFAKSGIITPKDLTATVVNNNVTKTYDATTDVVNAAGTKLTGAELVTLNGLVDGDGASNNTTAAYNFQNAGSGTVTYKLAVTGGEDASNYHIVDSLGLSGGGTINKRDLQVTAITPQTKVYDGNSGLVSTLTAGNFTLSDGTAGNIVLGKDHTALDVTKISGQYGTGTTDTSFKASPNVSEVTNVGYSGFKNALGADALQNYNISDTAYGAGSLTKAAISAGDFHFTIDGVAREYDATTQVGTTAGNFVKDHYVTLSSGKNADFSYSIDSAEYMTNGTAQTVKDVGTGKTVVYTIKIDPVSFANYKVDSSVTSRMQFHSDTGAINKKAVYASAVSDNLTKTYDGTENLRNGNPTWSGDTATGIELKGDAVIKLDGLVAGDNAVNESTGSYVGTGVGMGNKAINYTIAIDSAHAGNYVIRDARSKADITTLTTNTNTINPYGLAVNFDSVNRDYNGTTAIDPTLVNPHLSNTLNGDVISLAAGYTANYIDPNVKTVNARPAASVNYDGLKLGGSGAGNYTLVNSSGTVLAASTDMTGTQIATGAGTMNKFKLTGNNVTFSFAGPIAKEYDATNVVEYKGATTSEALRNYLQDHYVTLGNGSKQDIVVDMDSVTYDDANHGTGKTVTFKMSLNGDNYDYSDLQDHHIVDDQGKFNAQRTNGEITKRVVYASLTNNPTDSDIVKTYDGTDKVLQDTTGKVIFRDGDLLTSKDGVTLDINTRYADANAGTNKDVYYGLALKGAAASNYEIHDLTKISDKSNDGVISQLAGKGTINKKELTALFDRQEKDYDGNSVVEAKSPILSGLVNNDSLTLDKTRITGKYGTWDALTRQFKEDSNVSRDAAGNVTDKGVYYTGLADALTAGGAIAQNYTIADTVYFDEAAGKGRIKPLTITQAALANWRQVTKEYDATTGVPRDKQKDALSLSVTGTLDNAPIILDYTVKSASYDNQNAAKDHTLSYTISDVNKNLGNYQLSDDAAATIRDTTWTSTADNIITPRTINASLLNDKDVTKVYDGTTSAAAGNLVIDKDDAAVLAKDGLSAVITAEYNDDANATIDPGAAHSNTKTVTYTLGLAASSPNYSISTTTYTATGDIERRTLDVVADPLTVDVGAVMPVSFSGKVNGLIMADSDLASGFTFHVDDKVTTSTPGSYGIYGWYNNQRSGQMGQNYVFSQNIGNDKAFTVRLNNPGMEYNNTINPKGQFRPDQTSYQQSSKDQTSSFNGKPEAALEYRDKNGSVLGKTTDSAGSLSIAGTQAADMDSLSQIGISKGNVVNLSSARVANAASVEVDSNGTVVNLEIVPTSAVSSDRQASAAIENAM